MQQPVEGQPAAPEWQYPKFRVTLQMLQAKAKRAGMVTETPVRHINFYCEWVERVGNPNMPQAILSLVGMFDVSTAEAKGILSDANGWASRIGMPLYYHRLTWGTRIHKAKSKQPLEFKPEKLPLAEDWLKQQKVWQGLDRRLIELSKTTVSTYNDLSGKTIKLGEEAIRSVNILGNHIEVHNEAMEDLEVRMKLVENKLRGVRKGPSPFTKLHREVTRRFKVLFFGGK